MSPQKVSILIPTLNGEEDLGRLLPALGAQRTELDLECIAIDSSSEDRTVERLRAAGFTVQSIARSEFGHGRTRNALADLSTGDFLIFLSQDAVPVGEGFVDALVAPLADESLAGVTARVLPQDGDDPLTARTVLESAEASQESETRRWGGAELTGAERSRQLRFNNVASCIRAAALRAIPFPEVPFGEDHAWAARAMSAGWGIHHTGTATVQHAHRYGPRAAYARYRVDAEFHREFHGRAIRPHVFSALKGLAFELRRDLAYSLKGRHGFAATVVGLLRAPALRTAQVLGQWAGSRPPRPGDASAAAWAEARARGALDVASPSVPVRSEGSPSGPSPGSSVSPPASTN